MPATPRNSNVQPLIPHNSTLPHLQNHATENSIPHFSGTLTRAKLLLSSPKIKTQLWRRGGHTTDDSGPRRPVSGRCWCGRGPRRLVVTRGPHRNPIHRRRETIQVL